MANKSLHYSYIQTEFNDKNKIKMNIFSTNVLLLLKYINHPALIQEWKLNLDAETNGKILMITRLKLLIKIN